MFSFGILQTCCFLIVGNIGLSEANPAVQYNGDFQSFYEKSSHSKEQMSYEASVQQANGQVAHAPGNNVNVAQDVQANYNIQSSHQMEDQEHIQHAYQASHAVNPLQNVKVSGSYDPSQHHQESMHNKIENNSHNLYEPNNEHVAPKVVQYVEQAPVIMNNHGAYNSHQYERNQIENSEYNRRYNYLHARARRPNVNGNLVYRRPVYLPERRVQVNVPRYYLVSPEVFQSDVSLQNYIKTKYNLDINHQLVFIKNGKQFFKIPAVVLEDKYIQSYFQNIGSGRTAMREKYYKFPVEILQADNLLRTYFDVKYNIEMSYNNMIMENGRYFYIIPMRAFTDRKLIQYLKMEYGLNVNLPYQTRCKSRAHNKQDYWGHYRNEYPHEGPTYYPVMTGLINPEAHGCPTGNAGNQIGNCV